MPDRRPSEDLSDTHRRPQHASSETDMSYRRPIGNRHAPLETNIPHGSLGDQNACGDPSEFNRNLNTLI